jgi:organic radical activating enzyme
MYVDIVGACNLKCPSCPMGNSENQNSKKAMPIELFRSIVKKAVTEGITSLHLYNWTEPLVHPKIGEFVREVESAGIRCGISSNLNLSKNLESAVSANPSYFRISLSGFNQETYKLGHAGGDIEDVKRNMVKLSELKSTLKLTTDVEVYYHRYLDNTDEESLMRSFSENLGFRFASEFAVMMPLEKALAIVEGDNSISEADRKVLKRLALPPYPDVIDIAQQYGNVKCHLKDGMIVIDCEGNVILCCSVFNQLEHSVGKYLDLALPVIQKQKNSLPQCTSMCDRCTNHNLHVYAQFPNQGALFEHAINRSLEYQYRRLAHLPPEDELPTSEKICSFRDFDEAAYLANNTDVRMAVNQGFFRSGYQHYTQYGKHENRPGVPIQ